ncbi:D-alanyl-D-alanine carboxypeptidase family protein [Marinilactibacillus psychrotolerans]|uniref:M15 family metallopeptidase n=1 Tax=Marinilactibacillus psychrotolerans TaxID=191770 RepID=UPI003888E6AF
MIIKRRFILLFSTLILTGCSVIDNESATNQKVSDPTIEEQKENKSTDSLTKDNQSEEEIEHLALIESLPENVSSTDWNLILVNNWTPLPDDFKPDLVEIEPGKLIDRRIVDAYKNWEKAASETGYNLYFASGYRSVERQQNNYDRSINQYMEEGDTEEEATKKTEEYIAIPKNSEHHTGLAMDIVDQNWISKGNGLTPDYDTQESQHWLIKTMADYGFILRYPKNKKELTDINYESWHFRYVGEDNAKFIVDNNLTLEEYIELLKEREVRIDE